MAKKPASRKAKGGMLEYLSPAYALGKSVKEGTPVGILSMSPLAHAALPGKDKKPAAGRPSGPSTLRGATGKKAGGRVAAKKRK
jgi:hypothetical protein